ncbi:unnamed protein product [Arabidopsis thaliana]|uniref:F-box domain-containing protein n=1 Tax=Arabidopsis thaliana TaxID=3702 RepID=A0A654FX24_ARATH|nr:unnamed protein product [Arabidopsis thaliana]
MSKEDESHMTFSMLPDDLVLNCLARVSKVYYPSLSFVSKKFRSLIASTELQELRSFLGCTSSGLYVCLRFRTNTDYRQICFTLRQKISSSAKILVPISSLDSPFDYRSGVVAVGSDIYAIGGRNLNNSASSKVMVMDCRSHTWREAPSMRVARDDFPSTCVLNGKIYVIGGCKNLDSTNWIEVFDTKTQTSEFLQIPNEEECRGFNYKIVGYKEAIHVSSLENNRATFMTYEIHKGRWREPHLSLSHGFHFSNCVIENVFYRYSYEMLQWYDSCRKIWKNLKGFVRRSIMNPRGEGVKMVNYGGNIVLLWEECVTIKKKLIWCEEVVIEKKHQGEIWGLLKWSDVVFITDEKNQLVRALAPDV